MNWKLLIITDLSKKLSNKWHNINRSTYPHTLKSIVYCNLKISLNVFRLDSIAPFCIKNNSRNRRIRAVKLEVRKYVVFTQCDVLFPRSPKLIVPRNKQTTYPTTDNYRVHSSSHLEPTPRREIGNFNAEFSN